MLFPFRLTVAAPGDPWDTIYLYRVTDSAFKHGIWTIRLNLFLLLLFELRVVYFSLLELPFDEIHFTFDRVSLCAFTRGRLANIIRKQWNIQKKTLITARL